MSSIQWNPGFHARSQKAPSVNGIEALDPLLDTTLTQNQAYRGIGYLGAESLLLGNVIGDQHSGSDCHLLDEDRFVHTHVLGNSGSGKTTLFYNMITQDIDAGHGLCLLEPSGTLFDKVLKYCMWRYEQGDKTILRRLHLFDPHAEAHYVTGFNPLPPCRDPRMIPTAAGKFAETILRAKGLDSFTQSPRLALWLHTIGEILLLTEQPLIAAVPLMSLLAENPEREAILAILRKKKPLLAQQYDALLQDRRQAPRELSTQLEAVRNVLLSFLSKEYIRETVGARDSLDIEKIMREGHILLFHTSVGNTSLSDSDAHLLACFLMSQVYQTAMGRLSDNGVLLETQDLKPFFVYVDEFARYLSREVIRGLAELRRYRVGYILAHQYIDQLRINGDDDILQAVTNSTQNKIVMAGLSDKDAEMMALDLFSSQVGLKVEKHRIETKSQWARPAEIRTLENTSRSQGTATSHTTGKTLTAGETVTHQLAQPDAESAKPLRIRPHRSEDDFGVIAPPGANESLDEYERRAYQQRTQRKRAHDNWLTDQDAQESRYLMQEWEREQRNNGNSRAVTRTEAHSQQHGTSTSSTEVRGTSQTLYEEKYEVTQTSSIQFYSKDELLFEFKKRIRGIPIGHAILKVSENRPIYLKFPLPAVRSYTPDDVRAVWRLLHKYHPSVYRADLEENRISRTLTQHPSIVCSAPATPEIEALYDKILSAPSESPPTELEDFVL